MSILTHRTGRVIRFHERDGSGPTATTTITGVTNNLASVQIVFSEYVTGFELGDITVSGGSVANLSTSNNITFTVEWTLPTGTISTLDVNLGVCRDRAGNSNTAANQVTAGYLIPYNPSKDTHLSSGSSNRNFGITTLLGYGTANFPWLMQFDLSLIPAAATIVSNALNLYQSSAGSASAFTTTLYSISAANSGWPEGTKNNSIGADGDCTWDNKNQAATPTPWAGSAGLATAGTDYNSTSIGSFSGNRSDANGTLYQVTFANSLIQSWLGESNSNYGILAKTNAGSATIASREHATTSWRPTLLITFYHQAALPTPEPEPPAWPGEGPTVYVTNLNDSGEGSFRAAVAASVAETVKFTVSGDITLLSSLYLNKALTIDGSDAPNGGICIRGGKNILVNTSNITIRHIRIRPGPPSAIGEVDALTVLNGADNFVMEYCSLSWSNDEIFRSYGSNCEIRYCIFSEPLEEGNHPEGSHAYGPAINASGLNFHHNLIAHSLYRNPKTEFPAGNNRIMNNVIYNCEYMMTIDGTEATNCDIIGNLFIQGLNHQNPKRHEVESYNLPAYVTLYVENNIGPWRPNDTLPETDIIHPYNILPLANPPRLLLSETPTSALPSWLEDVESARVNILSHAGAILPKRDSVDTRIVTDVQNALAGNPTGTRIDTPDDVGGYPDLTV